MKQRPKPNFGALRKDQRQYSPDGTYYADVVDPNAGHWIIKHIKNRGTRIPVENASLTQVMEALARLEA